MSLGNVLFAPMSQPRSGRIAEVSKCATILVACTPASVRPAPECLAGATGRVPVIPAAVHRLKVVGE